MKSFLKRPAAPVSRSNALIVRHTHHYRAAWAIALLSILMLLLQACGSAAKTAAPSRTTPKPKTEARVVFPTQPTATPAGINYIYDYEELFTAAQEQALDSVVRSFEKSNLIPIKIATIREPSITAANFDLANKTLLELWSQVHGKSDRCMSISISKELRRIRIDYGPFVARLLADDTTALVIERDFKPSFKEGQYFEGTFNGLTALMNAIRRHITF